MSGSVGARFSAAAATYDSRAGVQRQAAGRVMELLGDVPAPRRILEIGCGTGQLTARLLDAYPAAEVHAIDLSPRMIAEAQKKPRSRARRVAWQAADIRAYSSPFVFPLVVSSSSLHWATPLARSLRNVDALARHGSCFVAAMMLRGTLPELHAARRRTAPGKAPRGRLPPLTEITGLLASLDWRILVAEETIFAERYRDADEFLAGLHDQGVTGGDVSRARRPLNRGELAALKRYYDAQYRDPAGGVAATYRVGLVKAVKQA